MKTFRTIWYTILILAVLIGLILRHEAQRRRHFVKPTSEIGMQKMRSKAEIYTFSFGPITTYG